MSFGHPTIGGAPKMPRDYAIPDVPAPCRQTDGDAVLNLAQGVRLRASDVAEKAMRRLADFSSPAGPSPSEPFKVASITAPYFATLAEQLTGIDNWLDCIEAALERFDG